MYDLPAEQKLSTEKNRQAANEAKEQAVKQLTESADLKTVAHQLQQVSRAFNKKLRFEVNSELDQVVVKVVDSETDKVIKELPPEELQRLRIRIREAIGLLFDETV